MTTALVHYVSSDGLTTGTIREFAPGRWIERNTQSADVFLFSETSRDAWSITLHDSSRGVDLELNLREGKIFYTDLTYTRAELYTVRRSARRASGGDAGWVVAGDDDGTVRSIFVDLGEGQWVEESQTADRAVFRFRETGRDDWSILLRDDSRGVRLWLDFRDRRVMYGQGGQSSWLLYVMHTALRGPP